MKRRSRAGSCEQAGEAPAGARSAGDQPPRIPRGPSEIAILDGAGRIVAVNHTWRESVAAFGFVLRKAGVGILYAEVACRFLPALDREGVERSLGRLLSGVTDSLRHTYAIETPAGVRWRHVQITPLSVGTAGHFVAIHDDQTELALAQEALQVTSEQLLNARDEERQRIAIELHDSTSQHLVAMGLSLARLRKVAGQYGAGMEIIDEISGSLKEAVKETRVLSYLMKPRGLGREGLSATVLQFLEGFARRTGLAVGLEADAAVDGLPPPLQHAVLRIVQEALLNAHRHAQASRVSVELGVRDRLVRVCVTDDGRGMQTGRGEPALGVGIPGMHARARQFSGDLAISSDETGTRVIALLPMP